MFTMLTKETIAKAIQNWRFDRSWTLEQMANACGLHITTIQRLEKGITTPHALTVGIIERKCRGIFDAYKAEVA